MAGNPYPHPVPVPADWIMDASNLEQHVGLYVALEQEFQRWAAGLPSSDFIEQEFFDRVATFSLIKLVLLNERMLQSPHLRKAFARVVEEEDAYRAECAAEALFPNPWLNLPLPHSASMSNHTGMDIRSSVSIAPSNPRAALAEMPNEILEQITKLLPPEAAAALAQTCKKFNIRLGDCYINRFNPTTNAYPTSEEKFRFLQLLERDTVDLVACSECRNLHRAYEVQPFKWPVKCAARQYKPKSWNDLYVADPFNTYNVIRAWALHMVRGPGHPLHSVEMQTRGLQNIVAASVDHEHSRRVHSVTARVVNGRLLVREQLVLAPFVNGKLTGWSIRFLARVLQYDRYNAITVCPHDLFKKLVSCEYDPDSNRDEFNVKVVASSAFSKRIAKSILPGKVYHLLYPPPGQMAKQSMSIGSSCHHCATDLGLAAQYKDMGGPGDGSDKNMDGWKYNSHQIALPSETQKGIGLYEGSCFVKAIPFVAGRARKSDRESFKIWKAYEDDAYPPQLAMEQGVVDGKNKYRPPDSSYLLPVTFRNYFPNSNNDYSDKDSSDKDNFEDYDSCESHIDPVVIERLFAPLDEWSATMEMDDKEPFPPGLRERYPSTGDLNAPMREEAPLQNPQSNIAGGW
ncbi:hypothetical protein B0T17DRAFT_618309 [Bombardia bombarda]|uniref:F-box domain-containing protein n=1 Tax=Bombardia bombarda TaxID=252184 RepID=A0AA39WUS0_9PEZI|nr:hypothetical protein B0T17DRAFT_618309 [Bombardia bombarda]